MTQTQGYSQVQDAERMRWILRLIAEDPELPVVVPQLLPQLRQMGRAAAAFCVAFTLNVDEQFVDGLELGELPDLKWLRKVTERADNALITDAPMPQLLAEKFAAWSLLAIHIEGELEAVVGLLFDAEPGLNDENFRGLLPLMDGLMIVLRIARADAQHHKMAHNQHEFVRIVSHDLRSPLTSMQGFASMLEAQMAGELNEKQLHFVEKILSGVGQMASLVENIQDAGRYDPETGFYEMERQPTDLIEIVKRIVSSYLVPAEKQELTLTMDVIDELPIVFVDSTMIARAIMNLVDNAIKYTPNGGVVEVGVHKEDEEVVFTVKDNGYGISEDNLELLFQRHFRIRRKEHKRVKGSGLGLFIVRSVARWHGGDAFVNSAEGEGSTFGFRIPLRGENLLGSAR